MHRLHAVSRTTLERAAEKQRIKTFILHEEYKIASFDARIDEAERLLASLRQHREFHRRRVCAKQRCLPDICRIPKEILVEIFTIYHESAPDVSSPTLLCQVCTHWREIALATSKLWKVLQVDLKKDVAGTMTGAADRFQRAQGSPVKLTITDSKKHLVSYGQITSLESSLEDFMRSFSATIESLTMRSLPAIDYMEILGGDELKPFPCLRDVHLEQGVYRGPDRPLYLHHLSLPWAQLTYIYITTMTPLHSAAWALTRCANLVDCTIAVKCTSQVDSILSNETCTLPKLHRLHLILSRRDLYLGDETLPDFYGQFFDAFTLPALKHFHLDVSDANHYNSPENDQRIIAFKKRSLLNLESFELETYQRGFALDPVLEFMTDMPALSSIRMQDALGCTGQNLMQWAFTRGHSRQMPGLAPNLTELVCMQTFPTLPSVDLMAVIAMAKSRSRRLVRTNEAQTYLKKLHMTGCGDSRYHKDEEPHDIVEAAIVQFKGRGVDFQFD